MAVVWRRLSPIVLFVGVAAVSPTAWAEPSPTDDPRVLKARADEAMVNLEYAEALRLYDAVFEITRDPALHYNRSRALSALQRFPEALARLEAFAREAPPELRARVPQLEQFLDEARQRVHTVTVRTRPAGASVRLDDVVLGVTPIDARAVNAGRARIRVGLEGHEAVEKDVDLPGAGSSVVEIALVPRDRRGTLVVRSPVEGAAVFVGGVRRGQVPLEVRLPAGSHVVRLEREGFHDADRAVVLDVGERETLDVGMDEVPPITERWWFWTTIGAVVATGAAVGIGIALTTERDPGSGDIAPGQIPVGPAMALPF